MMKDQRILDLIAEAIEGDDKEWRGFAEEMATQSVQTKDLVTRDSAIAAIEHLALSNAGARDSEAENMLVMAMQVQPVQPAEICPQTVVTDAEIEVAFSGTNFGHTNYRKLLEASVFKKLVNYHCGHTVTVIMTEMGLIGKHGNPTKKGIAIVRETYSHLMKVGG